MEIRILLVIAACVAFCAGRHSIDEKDIILFMSIINVIALGLVIVTVLEQITQKCKACTEKMGYNTSIKEEVRKKVKRLNILIMLLYVATGILIMSLGSNAVCNDVISIIALAISIINIDIIKLSASLIKKYARKIANKKKN